MIKLNNIEIAYGDNVILSNFNLSIEQGESVAIVGRTGCGKSSLLNLITMLTKPKSGTVEICGEIDPIFSSKQGQNLLLNKLGIVFQNNVLLENKTVLENLEVSFEEDGFMSMNEALKLVSLTGYEDRMVYSLSGGEQQRVALVRVLIKRFDVLIGDEITGSLDVNTRDEIIDILVKLKKYDKTIILVTHDLELANVCDRIINIDDYK